MDSEKMEEPKHPLPSLLRVETYHQEITGKFLLVAEGMTDVREYLVDRTVAGLLHIHGCEDDKDAPYSDCIFAQEYNVYPIDFNLSGCGWTFRLFVVRDDNGDVKRVYAGVHPLIAVKVCEMAGLQWKHTFLVVEHYDKEGRIHFVRVNREDVPQDVPCGGYLDVRERTPLNNVSVTGRITTYWPMPKDFKDFKDFKKGFENDGAFDQVLAKMREFVTANRPHTIHNFGSFNIIEEPAADGDSWMSKEDELLYERFKKVLKEFAAAAWKVENVEKFRILLNRYGDEVQVLREEQPDLFDSTVSNKEELLEYFHEQIMTSLCSVFGFGDGTYESPEDDYRKTIERMIRTGFLRSLVAMVKEGEG